MPAIIGAYVAWAECAMPLREAPGIWGETRVF